MNANPFVKIKSENQPAKVGKLFRLRISTGNKGDGTIPKNALLLTISVPDFCKITGKSNLKGSDFRRWKVKSLDAETIQLLNTKPFKAGDEKDLLINVRGWKVGGPSQAPVNISYNLGNTPEGPPYTSAGNTEWVDDNSMATITIIK